MFEIRERIYAHPVVLLFQVSVSKNSKILKYRFFYAYIYQILGAGGKKLCVWEFSVKTRLKSVQSFSRHDTAQKPLFGQDFVFSERYR